MFSDTLVDFIPLSEEEHTLLTNLNNVQNELLSFFPKINAHQIAKQNYIEHDYINHCDAVLNVTKQNQN